MRQYRKEIDSLVAWCKDNNLSLNISKVKELVIDFWKQWGGHIPVHMNGAEMEKVKSFNVLGVNITNNLSWSIYVDTTVKCTT
eukprot:g32028.t1